MRRVGVRLVMTCHRGMHHASCIMQRRVRLCPLLCSSLPTCALTAVRDVAEVVGLEIERIEHPASWERLKTMSAGTPEAFLIALSTAVRAGAIDMGCQPSQ